jgi:hypothetical protein
MATTGIHQKLDGGLVLRTANPDDMEAIARFNGELHVDPGEEFVEHIAHWTRDLGNGKHPTATASNFTLVEDTKTGKVVSTMCLIEQTWAYEGIEFPAGRPELVGTAEDYRRRGLVRRQFEVIHEMSAARGHTMQFITGIPWYYRQFGYEMAVNLGGRRQGYVSSIPPLKDEEKEPVRFRKAQNEDLGFIARLYNQSSRRSLVSCVRDDRIWQYELNTRHKQASMAMDMRIIESPRCKSLGYLFTVPVLYSGRVYVRALEVIEGYSWYEIAHPMLRQLKGIGAEYAESGSTEGDEKEMTGFSFDLGEEHPIYAVIPSRMPVRHDPYAYYIRVPKLLEFLELISPVLEERLGRSYMARHTGDLNLNFFTHGIKMHFEKGKVKQIEPWEKPESEDASAHFPDQTFLQLVFGYRDVQALEDAFPDLYYPKEEAKYLLKSLFPRKPSRVLDFG